MAVASSKVALHLYLNNPYGLLSAMIPNYEIYTPDKVPSSTPSPNGVISPSKFPTPLPGIMEVMEIKAAEGPEAEIDTSEGNYQNNPNRDLKIRFQLDEKDDKQTFSSFKSIHSDRIKDKEAALISGRESKNTGRDSKNTMRSKSTSGQSSDTNISGESSPRLGFTWSINVEKEKRRRKLVPPRPTPDSLLQKLGRQKNIEPVGIIKIKRSNYPPAHVSSYHIQKASLNEKGQRRVSEKLAEWLDQYNEVSFKQQEYLKKIHSLRRSLQNTDDKRMTVTIDKMRGTNALKEELETTKHRRKFPVYTLTKLEGAVINNGPSSFPNRPLIVHTDDKKYKSNIKLAPNVKPRKLAPIVKKIKTPRGTTSLESTYQSTPISDLSPRPEMVSKMTTEYEPFESIARRNRLNLHQFWNPSIAIGQKSIGKRMPVAMSNVRIINEVAEAHSDMNKTTPPADASRHNLAQKKSRLVNNIVE